MLILKKHFQNHVYEESWGRSMRLIQGAFMFRGVTLHNKKQSVNTRISFLKKKLLSQNLCRCSPQKLFKTEAKKHCWAFWRLHLCYSRDGTTPLPNLFSEMCARKVSGDPGSLDKVHWLPAGAKNKIIFCIKKLVFFPFFLFSWKGEECFYFSLCIKSLKTTNKSLKVHTLMLMQSEQELLKHQSAQWTQKDSCLRSY